MNHEVDPKPSTSSAGMVAPGAKPGRADAHA